MVYYVINDMLQTPHKGIIIEIGKKTKFEKVKVNDWKLFDWVQYNKESGILLANLGKKWTKNGQNANVDSMATELQNWLKELVDKLKRPRLSQTIHLLGLPPK